MSLDPYDPCAEPEPRRQQTHRTRRGAVLSRSKIASALRRAGRQRNIETRAEQIQTALRAPQLEQPPLIARR